MQLHPGETFVVVRQLIDPFDTGTYYVQAKIRNARTDVLLETLNLTDKGSQRFTKEWRVPFDPTGLGFYVDIETMVYTDAGYSSVSDVYRRENETYLVQDRLFPGGPGAAGGGGPDIDYKRIGRIILGALRTLGKPKRQKKLDLSPMEERLLEAIEDVRKAVDEKEVPDATPELKALQDALQALQAALEAKIDGIPEPEKVDLAPVLAAVEESATALERVVSASDRSLRDDIKGGYASFEGGVKKVLGRLKKIPAIYMNAQQQEDDDEDDEPEEPAPKQKPATGRVRKVGSMRGLITLDAMAGAVVLGTLAAILAGALFFPSQARAQGSGSVGTLDQWTSTSTPTAAITQRSWGKAIKLTGLSDGCLSLSSSLVVSSGVPCGAGGGGSGGGTWATTTSTVAGRLINYPLNTTDIVVIGSTATTTGEFYFDPNLPFADLNATTSINALAVGSTAIGSNVFKVSALSGLTVSNSESVGGIFNANFGTTDSIGAVYYSDASGSNRLVSVVCDNASFSGNCLHIRSDGTTSAVNVLGAPTGQGIIKAGASAAGDANASVLSLDASTNGFLGQLFFGICGSSTICSQIRDSGGTNQLLTLLGNGNLGLATSSPYAKLSVVGQVVAANYVATTTATSTFAGSLAITETNATSTFAGGIDLSDGCFALDGVCLSSGGSGTVSNIATTYPVQGGPITTTGTISLAFGTTTSNTWAGTQTFTNSPAFTPLSGGLVVSNSGSDTIFSGPATTTPTIGASLSYSGTFGDVIGGASGTLSLNMGNANTWTALQTFANSSTTAASFGYASSTRWYGGGLLADCDTAATSKLLWDTTTGQFSCGTDQTGAGGGSWPFTPATYGGVAVQSTSTPLWLTTGIPSLIATSTFSTYASTTQLTISQYGAAAGIYITEDGDGAYTTQGIGNNANESFTLNLDDTPDVGVYSSATGLVAFDYPNIRLRMDGIVIDGDGTFPASSDNSLLIGDGTDTGTFEMEDGPACIGDDGCTPFGIDGSLTVATYLGIGTSTPAWPLTISSSTRPQISLTDASGTSPIWSFRNAGGVFYLGTSSPATFATTTRPFLTMDGNTGTTSISGPLAATSTQYIYSTAAGKGATIIMEDTDGAGCTEVYALNGVLTAQTVACPTEI